MTRHVIATPDAPAAIGPYSQAVQLGSLLFTSGQIPLDPKTQAMVEGGIAAQAERVMQNLEAVLKAAGCTFADVCKTNIYLSDLAADFAPVNEIYGKRFTGEYPARSTIQVAALPRGARVEIEMIALKHPHP